MTKVFNFICLKKSVDSVNYYYKICLIITVNTCFIRIYTNTNWFYTAQVYMALFDQ